MSKKVLPLLSILLFSCFIYFSYLVHRGLFSQLDFDTTVRLQNHISSRWNDPFSIISLLGTAELTGIIWFAILVYAALKKYWLTWVSLLLFLSSALAELYGKLFVYHPAPPFLFYKGVYSHIFPSSYIHTSYSYPSGHSIRITFLVVFLLFAIHLRYKRFNKIWFQGLLISFLVLVYISRIYLGEHWLSDVVGGALLGGSLGMLAGLSVPEVK